MANPYDKIAEAMRQEQESADNIQLRSSLIGGMQKNPDDVADSVALAKKIDAPYEAVEADKENVRTGVQLGYYENLMKERQAKRTEKFLQNPVNAALAHDDVDSLTRTENLIDRITDVPRAFGAGVVRDFIGNIVKGQTELLLISNYAHRMMGDVYSGAIGVSDDRLRGDWDNIAPDEAKQIRDEVMKPARAVIDAGNRIDAPADRRNMLTSIISGLGQVTGQIGAGFVMGPLGQMQALISQGVGSISDDVQKDADAAKNRGEVLHHSRVSGALLGGGLVTGVTEKLSLEILGGPIASKVKNRAARYAARGVVGGVSEGTQEVTESLLHTLTRRALTNENAEFASLAELGEEFTVSGAVGVIAAAALGIRRFRKGKSTEQAVKALGEEAKASKLNGRAKEEYKNFTRGVAEDAGVENAYIDAEAWQSYFQSQNIDPRLAAEQYGASNYDEAVTTGADILIPFAEFQADFAASDHLEVLTPDIKFSEDGTTGREAAAISESLRQKRGELDKLLQHIDAEQGAANTVNNVIDELTEELTGQLDGSPEARIQANLLARSFAHTAGRDIVAQAQEKGRTATPEEIAEGIRARYGQYDLQVIKEGENGNQRKKFEKTETVRHQHERGFTENRNPTESERAEADRQYAEVESKYRKSEQWMKAPDGQPSKLTEHQWLQVRTENFNKWFGYDWQNDGIQHEGTDRQSGDPDPGMRGQSAREISDIRAKIHEAESGGDLGRAGQLRAELGKKLGNLNLLDPETGEPRLFHHGTKDSFDAFDLSHPNRKDAGNLGDGIYLAADSGSAELYGRSKQGSEGVNVMPLFVRMKNPYIEDATNKSSNLSKEESAKRAEALKEHGYDGILAYDFNQPDWQANPVMAVVFSPEQVKSAVGNIGTFSENHNILYQAKDRGALRINPERKMRIETFENADFSTFSHEGAHFMLEVMGDLARADGASQYIRNEYKTVLDYLGAKEGATITEEQHENFARSFEAYLMEGKAPSPELRGAFQNFKKWLTDIYKSLKTLNVKLSNDIREVFDRMLATDEEIEVARAADEYANLFATAEMMGVTQGEFDAYTKLAQGEIDLAKDELRAKVMKEKLREKRKEYRAELERVKEKAAREYDESPVVQAFNDIQQNGLLSKYDLVKAYGDEFVSKLPKRLYSPEGHLTLEEAADSFGFESGDILIKALSEMPTRKRYIEAETKRIMAERRGDLLNSEALADEAHAALNNELRDDRIKKELAALNRLKRAGDAARQSDKKARQADVKEAQLIEKEINAQREAMKWAAADIIASKKVRDVRPYTYLNAARSAAGRARAQLSKTNPDYTAAATLKYKEMMNNLLYREALNSRRFLDAEIRKAKEIVKRPVEKAIKSRDALEVYKAKYIAAKVGLGGDPEVLSAAIQTEEQYSPDNDPFSYNVAGNLKDMPVSNAKDVLADIAAHWEQSRRNKVMVIEGRRVDLDNVAEAVSEELDAYGSSIRPVGRNPNMKERFAGKIADYTAMLTRVESWTDRIGGKKLGEEPGAWTRYLFRPVKEAADRARQKQGEFGKRLQKMLADAQFSRETIEAPELEYTFGKNVRDGLGRAELYHALLHTGNESNKHKLLIGRGWGELRADGTLDTSKWDSFVSRLIREKRLTKADFDRVQGIWNLFDDLKPSAQRAHKEVFGRYFKEITSEGFHTPFGYYEGGYIPAIYDRILSDKDIGNRDVVKDLINEMHIAMPRNTAGWGKTRNEAFVQPLLLDLSVLPRHMFKQILFSELAPVNKDVSALLNKQRVNKALKQYDADFKRDVLIPWLGRAITQNVEGVTVDGSMKVINDAARFLRVRAGASIMFGNIINSIEQFVDVTAAASKVKPSFLYSGFRLYMSDRKGVSANVKEMSTFMRNRLDSELLALNGHIERSLRNPSRMQKADRWMTDNAYFMQTAVDDFTSVFVWTGSYNQSIASGVSHTEAIAQADSVIRQSMGTNAAEDISNWESGSPLKRMFAQFSGFFVQRGNLMSSEISKLSRDGGLGNHKAQVAAQLMYLWLLPAWIGDALRKALGGDDDDFGGWLLAMGLSPIRFGLALGGPVGTALSAGLDKATGKYVGGGRIFYPPAIKMLEDALSTFGWFSGNKVLNAKNVARDLSAISRVAPGVPIVPNRPQRSIEYMTDVVSGEEEPTGPVDFTRGVVSGQKRR